MGSWKVSGEGHAPRCAPWPFRDRIRYGKFVAVPKKMPLGVGRGRICASTTWRLLIITPS